ncbi:hypothetical protein [Cohnella zeiphila]|uniref:Uncharacterized protein n=1 Tax=Cohnella zeiphila TaxID=2761120 RepID=A0A7X0SS91_9BACL|nr:hypothetical protein [Cohnella zeiphila]MBB6735166.1 hypothetical protein [Cohnella zeiphila]
MLSFASQVITVLKPYFDSLLRQDPQTGERYIYDDELGDRASCCTTGAAASFYAWAGKRNGSDDGLNVARELVREAARRQLPGGGFGQPFYVKKGEPDTVDIAEVGAIADSLYHVHRATGSEEAKASLIRSADYLLTQVSPRNPAAILKRPGEDFDVLNGDMYAAHTFGRAYELSGNPVYLEKVRQIFVHLADRFGKNEPGWWPYIENWDGSVFMGNSVLYQATIVGLAHSALPLLDEELQIRWERVAEEAMNTMLQAIRQPPSEATEAPWWSRDWSNGWELYLCFCRSSAPEVRKLGEDRFAEAAAELAEQGVARFRPKIGNPVPDRTPVTTTFRKAAGFASLFANLAFESGGELE